MTTEPVDLERIRAAVDAVRPLGMPYVLIGGNALVVLGIDTATYHIDVGIRLRDFTDVAAKLKELGWSIEVQGNAIGAFRDERQIEFIHPGPFGPRNDPDRFFEYVLSHASVDTDVGPTAKAHVVWYMRLCFEPEMGRQKILQDIKLGLLDPRDLLEEVDTPAAAMGREDQVRPHLAWIKSRL